MVRMKADPRKYFSIQENTLQCSTFRGRVCEFGTDTGRAYFQNLKMLKSVYIGLIKLEK